MLALTLPWEKAKVSFQKFVVIARDENLENHKVIVEFIRIS